VNYLNPHTHVLDQRTKSLAEMTAEIRANNVEKGWRSAEGGPGNNTFGDYIALLHSEVSEALEAYRDHRLADATTTTVHARPPHGRPKPQGVGSELADVLIRLLDTADVFGIEVRVMPITDCDASGMESFGDHLAWLHYLIANLIEPEDDGASANYRISETLQALHVVAERYGIDLPAEYERKIAYNRTRSFQHGGRTVSDAGRA
jgi:NTP pyrophosphatase (non-canonical NTP hydrolase)